MSEKSDQISNTGDKAVEKHDDNIEYNIVHHEESSKHEQVLEAVQPKLEELGQVVIGDELHAGPTIQTEEQATEAVEKKTDKKSE
jgi:hypothetical protein